MPLASEHLEEANRHVAEFTRRVADQIVRIDEMKREGLATADAQFLLREFNEALRLAIEHREIILREIAAKTK